MRVTFQHPPTGTLTPFIDFDPGNVDHYPKGPGGYIYGIKLEIEISGALVKKFVPLCVGETINLSTRLYNDHFIRKFQNVNDNITKAAGKVTGDNKELWDFSFPSYSQYDISSLYTDMDFYDVNNTGGGKTLRPYLDHLARINYLIYFQNLNYFLVKYKNILQNPHVNYSPDQMVNQLYNLTEGLYKNQKESILQNCDKIIRTINNLSVNFYFIYFQDENITMKESDISCADSDSRHNFEKSIKNNLHNINIYTTADARGGDIFDNLEVDLSLIQDDLINLGNHNYGDSYVNPLILL